MLKYFLHKWKNNGNATTDIMIIIPFLLYISRTIITADNSSALALYALHITPWTSLGLNLRHR